MKARFIISALCLQLLALNVIANVVDTTATSKAYYTEAKNAIVKMLDGQAPLSYGRAIYLMENAYWDNKIDSNLFNAVINDGVTNILNIAASNNAKPKKAPTEDLWEQMKAYRAGELGYFDKAKINWAIYSYMTDTTIPIKEGGIRFIVQKDPYHYSFKDPFGTIDWSNTQVTHLLQTGSGNCFALASLFKIYSERLNSNADICTAPGHIYITHKDERGTFYNIELTSRSFPGTGTMETLTYTTDDAIKSNISLRQLDLKQSVALCLVYLAKGYEYKFKVHGDNFAFQCAQLALKYDSLNLNAMLLNAEVLETNLLSKNRPVAQLQTDNTFKEYQYLINHLYTLGYREMPLEMKNFLIKGWMRDTSIALIEHNHTPKVYNKIGVNYSRFASLSWGLFDEEIQNKPIEKYGHILFDTKKKKITQFVKEDILYNDYNFDPVVFALNVDPMAHKMPGWSPYAAFADNPILNTDPDGAFPWSIHIRSFISTPTAGGGLFMGDGRGAMLATDKSVTSRVRSNFIVDPAKQTISTPVATSDPSVFFGAGMPGSPGYLPPDVEVGKPHASIDNSNFANGFASFDFSHSGKDPITPQWATPSLDLHASMSIKENLEAGMLDIQGSFTGDKFPSSEAFIIDQSGKVKVFLGAQREEGGLKDLFGDNKKSLFNVNMQVPMDKNGNFTGTVKQGDKTYSIDDWNTNVQQQFGK